MKKVLSVILCILMLSVVYMFSVTASSEPTIKVTSAEALRGETVTVDVQFLNNPGINTCRLGFVYDETRLELIDCKKHSSIGGFFEYKTNAVWLNSTDVTYSGTYFVLTFKLRENAPAGDAVVEVEYMPGDICNRNEEDKEFLTESGVITVHEHTYSTEVTREATCTNDGEKTFTCDCGDSYTEAIEKLGHNYSSSYTVDKKATCSKEGSKSKHCTRSGCTAKTSVKVIAKIKHTYDNSCDTTCNACKAKRSITHSYKTTTSKATLTKDGKIVNKCTVCGSSKSSTVYYPKTIILSTTSYIYDGKVKTPAVTVKDSKGNTLKKDIDYTVKNDDGRKSAGKYTVTVTFKGKYEGTKKLYFTITPKMTSKITASQTTSTITLKWNKVTGADGYRIYQYNSKTKKWDTVKTVSASTLSYKVSKLKSGTAYKYKVRAYTKDDGTIWGDYSKTFETATKPATPKITKLTTTKGKASFTWSNISGETGYEVYCSTKKDSGYDKVATYKANVVKGSKSKLKSNKTYYFKVRAYKKTASGTVYSAWSPSKGIKVK